MFGLFPKPVSRKEVVHNPAVDAWRELNVAELTGEQKVSAIAIEGMLAATTESELHLATIAVQEALQVESEMVSHRPAPTRVARNDGHAQRALPVQRIA